MHGSHARTLWLVCGLSVAAVVRFEMERSPTSLEEVEAALETFRRLGVNIIVGCTYINEVARNARACTAARTAALLCGCGCTTLAPSQHMCMHLHSMYTWMYNNNTYM